MRHPIKLSELVALIKNLLLLSQICIYIFINERDKKSISRERKL